MNGRGEGGGGVCAGEGVEERVGGRAGQEVGKSGDELPGRED